MDPVKQQYERFPYPPVSALALPRRGQGGGLQYERAVELSQAHQLAPVTPATHSGIRILVAGCGTLEALVVAQAHPQAAEVVALDVSRRSLAVLQRRLHWARTRDLLHLAPLRVRGMAPLRTVEADVRQWQDDAGFDYILANNMLHHTEQPAATLQHLAGLLKPGGVLRMVTYPAMSRFWLHRSGDWLRWHGLGPDTPGLKRRAVEVIEELPQPHPLRSCFEAHSETATTAGLVDAFFHACERPLTPLQWQQASASAGLEWLGETQPAGACADFLVELLPATAALSAWQRLQVLDDVLELNTNPVWWFCKRGTAEDVAADDAPSAREVGAAEPDIQAEEWYLPSAIYWQLGQALRRANGLLQQVDCSAEQLITMLRREVGPRVARDERELLGLTMGEYPEQELLQAPPPLMPGQWRSLQARLGEVRLCYAGRPVPGADLVAQGEWLQLYHGPLQGRIGPLTTEPA
jgi:SAM-dependent methyltransferase